MRSPAELTDAFRQQGLKLTRQRQVLFGLLHENRTHPTAEALHAAASRRVPGISLRTV
ncbi:MAG: transcriptional repressor, partial [Actinomycetota bacterium]